MDCKSLFSSLFCICLMGVTVTILGAVFHSQLRTFDYVTSDDSFSVESSLLVAAGCLLVGATLIEVITTAGRGGIISCLTFLMQITFYILILSAGIIACVHIGDLNYVTENDVVRTLDNYGTTLGRRFTSDIDAIQHKFHCCGVHNYTDWFNTTWAHSQSQNNSVPGSCCVKYSIACGQNVSSLAENIFHDGCFVPAKNTISNYLIAIGCISLSLFILTGVTRICNCCTRKAKKPELLLQREDTV